MPEPTPPHERPRSLAEAASRAVATYMTEIPPHCIPRVTVEFASRADMDAFFHLVNRAAAGGNPEVTHAQN